jgi:hypothetical protein
MSQTPTTAASSLHFQAIFQAALKSFQKQTKKDLTAHPLAPQLQSCNSTGAILVVLQDQVRVPSGGPKVDITAVAPWEVPNWVEHVSYMGVENPCVRKAWIRDLTVAEKGSNTMLIHLAAATLNREAEGLGVVGGAAATYSRGGRKSPIMTG